jgi:hypothetical protein
MTEVCQYTRAGRKALRGEDAEQVYLCLSLLFNACFRADQSLHILWEFPIVVDHTPDAVFELDPVEIHQQADVDVQQSEVRQQLSLVHRMERLFTLDLNYDPVLDNQVGAEAALQFHLPVDERDSLLPLHMEA